MSQGPSTASPPAGNVDASAGELFGAAEYRAVFEAAPDGIVIVDVDGRIRDLNPSAERLFGYARHELLGRGIETLVPEKSREVHRREREAYQRVPRTRPMGVGLELRGRRKDETEVPVEISLSPMETGSGRFVLAIVRDMTERVRLRAFGAGALQAAEDERLRIARDLHDDTAQRLAALLVRLRVARDAADGTRRELLLDEVHQEILEAADAVRRIAHGLRPPWLEEMGLEAAIRSLARAIREAHGLPIEVEAVSDGEVPRLGREAELAVYRIVQEALTNVVRHAGATRARVVLERSDERMLVLVEDDGRGFEPRGGADPGGRGLGLVGMAERARYLGGRVGIESERGRGTRVTVEIPRTPGAREE
ncbi:MAG TPA: PAS domain S-box protein [Gemmatimonadota bacterium]|nr:PAS domain S-box protein [Gemmatimonadota bacterium]